MRNWTSKRDKSAAGRLMFCDADIFGLNRPIAGLAAARMAVRALSVVVMPAFAIETVYTISNVVECVRQVCNASTIQNLSMCVPVAP